MNVYRVDVNQLKAPLGMNSIVYIGDSLVKAKLAFAGLQHDVHKTHFGKLVKCGSLSKWNEYTKDYEVVSSFKSEV